MAGCRRSAASPPRRGVVVAFVSACWSCSGGAGAALTPRLRVHRRPAAGHGADGPERRRHRHPAAARRTRGCRRWPRVRCPTRRTPRWRSSGPGGPFPYEEDGGVFGNRERILPRQRRRLLPRVHRRDPRWRATAARGGSSVGPTATCTGPPTTTRRSARSRRADDPLAGSAHRRRGPRGRRPRGGPRGARRARRPDQGGHPGRLRARRWTSRRGSAATSTRWPTAWATSPAPRRGSGSSSSTGWPSSPATTRSPSPG